MKQSIFLLLFLAVLYSARADEWQNFIAENSAPMLSPNLVNEKAPGGKMKNPKAAFLLSAAVPGAGQAYAKSYFKAAAFVAVEAAAWGFYVAKTKDGYRIEDEFHDFANTHWSETDYWRWIAYHSGIAYNEDNIEALREWEKQAFSHGLHREKDQQYYEMIGKYHQFSWGWDDFRENHDISITDEEITAHYNETGELNENRRFYETRRDASNDAFKKATTGATIAVINHLLSAADAAWSTAKYNRTVNVSLRVQPIYLAQDTRTVLTLHMTW